MSSNQNFYEVLGVSKSASLEEIKKVYRALVLKHHPDTNQGSKEAEDLLKKINEAYQVLSDTEKRRIYDAQGGKGSSGWDPSASPRNPFRGQSFNVEDLSEDFIRDIFTGMANGFRARQKQPEVNGNIQSITFEENIKGFQKSVEISHPLLDKMKADKGNKVELFNYFFKPGMLPGMLMQLTAQKFKEIDIKTGFVKDITLTDAINVNVRLHEFKTSSKYILQQGLDLAYEVSLTYPELLLGKTLEIETPAREKQKLIIPKGISDGVILKIQNQGLRVHPLNSQRSNLLFVVTLKPLESLTPGIEKALKKLQSELDKQNTGSVVNST